MKKIAKLCVRSTYSLIWCLTRTGPAPERHTGSWSRGDHKIPAFGARFAPHDLADRPHPIDDRGPRGVGRERSQRLRGRRRRPRDAESAST